MFVTVPGGTLSQEGEPPYKTDACIFNTPNEINFEIMKSWEQVFIKLMRRYKYLEKIFQVSGIYCFVIGARMFIVYVNVVLFGVEYCCFYCRVLFCLTDLYFCVPDEYFVLEWDSFLLFIPVLEYSLVCKVKILMLCRWHTMTHNWSW